MADKIQDSSRERVALDLATKIASDENLEVNKRNREYWLTLYAHCHRVVFHGDRDIKSLLEGWQLSK